MTEKTPDDVFKLAKDEKVEYVDVRFCDLPGIMQHFTIPASAFDKSVFDDGLAFDGSSIRGFQSIHESDMLLLPDPETARIDPFRAAKTLNINFFVHDPFTLEPYSRDPRNIARKAENYLISTGIADTAYFGAEAEFYIFDSVSFDSRANGSFYEVESPLRDARGFDLSRSAGPPPVVDADEVGAANMILTNGARLYVDHAHPEYSAPECTDPLDAVIWDKAGERVMEAAARHVASVPGAAKLQLYKNNVDGKGASYGSHENYLMSRQTPFSAIITGLTPFLVSRQVVTGSGRVGIGPSGDEPGFQLSQRSDYIEVEVGLETTLKRGIINTRDEPHADADRYRRLHVIIGDANLAETSTYLKLGTTALVLDLIEEGPAHAIDLTDLALARPVHAVHAISRDPSLRATVALADGRELTGLALQRIYLDRVAKLVDSRDPDPRAADIVETWAHVLDQLERDPMDCAELLDWPAKLRLLDGFRQRENLSWSAPRLHLVDLQYSDVRLDKGLYNRLVARGSMKRLVTEHQVLSAVENPPTDTRAYFRGECLRRFGADIAAASWDSVIFDLGGDSLVRIPTLEPLRGSKAHVGALLDSVDSAVELVEQLTAEPR